jgi:transposase
MTTERMSMRKIREILRQKWVLQRSHREVMASLGVGLGTVTAVLSRAEAAKLNWVGVEALADDVLEARLYARSGIVAPSSARPMPDCAHLHAERRRPGVTLQLLHLEYLEQHPNGYRYTAFCDIYRRWLAKRKLTMRQIHRAGEKLFVDYAGKKPHIVDRQTGACIDVELFVAVLGASNYTYAEATLTQSGPDWIASHQRTFAYIEGVPDAMVCDQLKSGVVVPCRYEPGVQRTYEQMAGHYGTAILPARPHKPRDKAKVEVAVLVVERWILARLRNQTFFSLEALNERIAELLEDLNNRRMK